MKRHRWQIGFGVALTTLSLTLYAIHYACFRDLHHILVYLVGDIAFVPIEVLMVTLVLHQLLSRHEKRSLLHKLNMAIGVFFSEVGTPLLARCVRFEPGETANHRDLKVSPDWTDKTFAERTADYVRKALEVDTRRGDLAELREFLATRQDCLLRLLENSNLLEHETFTDLLWAVFHLSDELARRSRLTGLPDTDYAHLSGDLKRAYSLLVVEWLAYMKHLKKEYPYLFSLAIRTCPFDPDAKIEIG